MDVGIKVDDIYMLTGISKPEPGDEVVTVSTQQLRQQRAMAEMQAEMSERQMRMQAEMQQEAMQQQAMMQQMMGGQPQEGGQPQGQPPQGGQPQEKTGLNETLDVSPQSTTRDDGPSVPASGEIDRPAGTQPKTDQEALNLFKTQKWSAKDLENYALLKSCSPMLSL
jgi:hypothetical protein